MAMSMYSISGQRIARLARAGEVSSTRTAASRSLPRRPRRPAPTGKRQPLSIAVLGGGLTGLTTAWYLAQHLPKTRITVYEATNRLGGWIDTVKVAVKTPDGQNGTVSFERGARMVHIPRPGTLKWDDMVLYEMVSPRCSLLLAPCSGRSPRNMADFGPPPSPLDLRPWPDRQGPVHLPSRPRQELYLLSRPPGRDADAEAAYGTTRLTEAVDHPVQGAYIQAAPSSSMARLENRSRNVREREQGP